jgi:hypothetical protein
MGPRENARYNEIENQIALLKAGGGGTSSGTTSTFVFQPGGVAAGNVYTDWATLVAAAALVAGPRWIEFDTSFAACVIPIGAWDFGSGNDVTFVGSRDGTTPISIDSGATFSSPITRWVRINATFAGNGGSPMVLFSGDHQIDLYENSSWTVSGNAPLLIVADPAIARVNLFGGSAILAGTADVIDADGGVNGRCFITQFDESTIAPNTLGEVGGGKMSVFIESAAATLNPLQAGVAGGVVTWTTNLDELPLRPIDGVVDDWPRLMTGFAPQAATHGVALRLMPGLAGEAWQCKSSILMPNKGFRLRGTPKTTVVQALGASGVADSAFYGNMTAPTVATTLAVQNAVGDSTLTLVAPIPIGKPFLLRRNGGQRSTQYIAENVVGNVVTLDRPTRDVYPIGAAVQSFDEAPTIDIDGEGMLITGAGSMHVAIVGAWQSRVRNLVMDDSGGALGVANAISFLYDTASVRSEFRNIESTCVSGSGNAGRFASTEDCWMYNCTGANMSAGLLATDAVGGGFVDCEAYGNSDGCQLGSDGSTEGSQEFQLRGCSFWGNVNGIRPDAIGNHDIDITDCTSVGNSGSGIFTDTGASGTRFRVKGGSYTGNTAGFGIWIKAGNSDWTIDGVDIGGNLVGIECDDDGTLTIANVQNTSLCEFLLVLAGKSTVTGCNFKLGAGGDSAIFAFTGATVDVTGGVIDVGAAPTNGVFRVTDANTRVTVRGLRFTGAAVGASTCFNTSDATQEIRRSQDVDVGAFATPFAGAGLKNWGTFNLNGAAPVDTACACKAGDVPAIVRTVDGGAPGINPLIVTTANQIAAVGAAGDTSTYGFIFP